MRLGSTVGLVRGAAWVVAAAAVVACVTQSPDERTARSSAPVFANGGFESGAPNNPPQSWTVQTFLNNTGVTPQSPQTLAGLNLSTGGNALTDTIAGPTLTQIDPDLGATASLRWPRYGTQCARVNFHSSSNFGNAKNVNALSQTMTVGAGDVDPSDGQVHIRFVVAPVLQNPGHTAALQPYYFVRVMNLTQNAVLYTDFNLSAQPGVPWKTVNGGTPNEIDYVDWSLVDVAPGNARLAMGDMVQLEIIAAGCQPGGHFGEVYVDGVGTTIPGLFVSGTGPAQANAGTNITYNLTYKNGSGLPEAGVTIDFTIPPGTTFQSITPPAGATCMTPAVGATGTIVCTFTGPVAAGAFGSFSITVNIDPATTGVVTAGNYEIHSAVETPLLGNKIPTRVGCATDSECASTEWCNETTHACTAKLANGTTIPTDPAHTNPTLNGTCTAAAGTAVCVSGVCDAADNKCGLANGDGPCTVGNGGTVCRSGSCGTNGLCGCNVDSDCANGWCNETSHTCAAKLPNGTAVPSDPAHMNPTLNGMCSAAAGTLVCASAVCDATDNLCGLANGDGPCTVANGGTVCRNGVCDTDGKCGLANGDGPCTTGNATTVCRSGTCSTNGTCEPMGGCNVDADCTGGNWCNVAAHQCAAKIANGGAMPTDTGHTTPTLNGSCTPAAAMLVCVTGVCDTDNKCGLANGDGPCAPDGGANVCRSSVCDTDDKCGLANGDGPCTGSNGSVVCRSTVCATSGTNGGKCEECSTNADCTGGKVCDATNHCVVSMADSGAPDSGARDSGAADTGAADSGALDASANADSSADGAAQADAAQADASTDDQGTIEGGGLSCSASPARSDAPSGALAALAIAGALAVRRRRAR